MKRALVILVNWNSFSLTNDCILSLKAADHTSFDIVVADNGSADGSGKQLKEAHPEIILLQADKNLGFTGGNNLGLQYALEYGYEYAMLLNNDTFVEPDFFTELLAYMDHHPEAGVVQPRIFFNHDRKLLWNGGSYYNSVFGIAHTKGVGKPSAEEFEQIKEVDWVTGCAFLTRTAILKQTGLLTEKLFIYYEDVDLSFRIKQLGYKLVYVPQSVIYHIAGMANKQKVKGKEGFVNPIVHYLNQRNRIWLLKAYTRWYHVPGTVLFNFFYTLGTIAYFALRLRFTKLKSVVKAVRDGLSGSIKTEF